MPTSQQEEDVPGFADARTPGPGVDSAQGQPDELTLHEFLTRLTSSPESRAAFEADPRASLDQAGLGDMSATDVLQATSLVLDYAPVEVVEEGRTLQSSVEKFAANSQYAAINHMHPAHPHEQEVTELSMLNSTPPESKPDFGHEGDKTNIDIEQNDSHNLVNIHDVASGNSIGGVGDSVSNTVGNVTGTVDNTVDTAGDLTANVGDVTGVAGGVTNTVGGVTGSVGDVAGGLPVVGDVAGTVGDATGGLPVVGDVTGPLAGGEHGAGADALPVDDLAGGVGGTLDGATAPVGGLVEGATAPAEPVLDAVEPVTSALPVGDVVNTLPAPSDLPVVGDVAGGAVENVAGGLPLDGLL